MGSIKSVSCLGNESLWGYDDLHILSSIDISYDEGDLKFRKYDLAVL